MSSFLKPNKANIIGTVLLVVAYWIAGFVPRLITPLFMTTNGTDGTGMMARGAYSAGSAGMRSGSYGVAGLAGSAAEIVVAVVLFYVILSFVIVNLAKSGEGKTGTKKR
jgi:hypothetical protein